MTPLNRNRVTTLTLLAAGLVALGACSQESSGPDAAGEDEAWPEVEIGTLAQGDLREADLTGELACSFGVDDTREPVFLARADVVPDAFANGVIKVDGRVEPVRSTTEGGFNAMLDGESFAGGGLMVTIAVTGEPVSNGQESPPMPARLEYESDDGVQMEVQGEWRCGP